jgi:hypothetical protein
MRVRRFQPIADSQTDSHEGNLWQLGRRPNLGSLDRLVRPPSEGHASTDEPRHRRQADRRRVLPMSAPEAHLAMMVIGYFILLVLISVLPPPGDDA